MAASAIMCSAAIPAEINATHKLALQHGLRKMSTTDFKASNFLTSSETEGNVRNSISAPTGEEEMITDPEGEKSVYVRTGYGFGQDMFGSVFEQSNSGSVSYFVTADDGKTVYVSNIFSQASPRGYVKGSREEDKIIFTFPQVVDYGYDSEGNSVPFFATVLRFDTDVQTFVPDDNQTFIFNIGADGILTPADKDLMIGWTVYFTPDGMLPDYYWQGVGDIFSTFGELNEKPFTAPADVDFSDWALVYNGTAYPILAAIKDDKVYVKDFLGVTFEGVEDATIVGTIKDGKVNFADSQYLGIDTWLMTTLYFHGGNPVYNDWGLVEEFESGDFTADFEENKITGTNSYIITHAAEEMNFETFVEMPTFAKSDPYASPAAPAAPYNVRYDEGTADNPENPIPYIDFSIPQYDINYNSIDYSNLYWELIVDSEPYVFTPEIYGVEENMTTVSYEYTSDDWSILSMGTQHYVDIRFSDYKTIGLRSVYKDDENTFYSDIVLVSGTTSVNGIESEETVSSLWYDIHGRKYSSPQPGIMIRADRKANGTVKYTKVIMR